MPRLGTGFFGPLGIIMSVTTDGARLIEPGHIQDVFVAGLAEVEDLGGGCYRFTFYAHQTIGGHDMRVVVARLIAPASAVPPAIMLAAKAVGLSLIAITAEKFINGQLN